MGCRWGCHFNNRLIEGVIFIGGWCDWFGWHHWMRLELWLLLQRLLWLQLRVSLRLLCEVLLLAYRLFRKLAALHILWQTLQWSV